VLRSSHSSMDTLCGSELDFAKVGLLHPQKEMWRKGRSATEQCFDCACPLFRNVCLVVCHCIIIVLIYAIVLHSFVVIF